MTAKPSHTPGPWKIMPLGTVIYAPSKVGPNVTICTGTTPANARLIAAAPELLEALKELTSQKLITSRKEAMDKALKAIAKVSN